MPSISSDYTKNRVMKSEKAEAYIDSHAKRAEDRICEASTEIGKIVLSVRQVIRAVEIAEQETEERMQTKAMEAFCAANCPKGCSFGADGNIGCGAKARFIQKLNE